MGSPPNPPSMPLWGSPQPDVTPPSSKVTESASSDKPTHNIAPATIPEAYVRRLRRSAWLTAGSIVALVVALAAWDNFWGGEDISSFEPITEPPVAVQPVQPNQYDTVRDWLGPWTVTDNTRPADPHQIVMLLTNGAIEAGSYTITPSGIWSQTSRIQGLDVQSDFNGNIKLRDSHSKIYVVKPGQPFIVQSDYHNVYAVQVNSRGELSIIQLSVILAHATAKTLTESR